MKILNTISSLLTAVYAEHPLLKDSERNAAMYQTSVDSLNTKIAQLGRRDDAAGRVARYWLTKWRDQFSDRLERYRKAVPVFEAACAELEAAQAHYREERARLELELEPAAHRERDAAQAYEGALRAVNLPYGAPPTAGHLDPGDTEQIAALAPKLKGYEPGFWNDCADKAVAQCKISVGEFAAAVAAEADYPGELERKAFDMRFTRWAYFHKDEVNAALGETTKETP